VLTRETLELGVGCDVCDAVVFDQNTVVFQQCAVAVKKVTA
jgi:hypothetical protein